MTMAFDKDTETKWLAPGTAAPWIAYTFAGNASRVIVSYAITSANDVPERDPASWQFQGSNDAAPVMGVHARRSGRVAFGEDGVRGCSALCVVHVLPPLSQARRRRRLQLEP